MKLLTKFNIVLLIFFGAGGLLIAKLASDFLLNNARDQVVQQAELMMAAAKATRDYTNDQLKPLLLKNPDHEINFLPQTVPAFSAITVFTSLRKNYTDYSYREATLNPTNLVDRAEDWEADIIRYFQDHPNEKQLFGERDTPTGRQLYLAKPMRAGASCLECHSEPSAAPAAMIRKYGSSNGFGWKLNQVIAAQVVSVPLTVPDAIAHKAYRNLILFLIAVFVVTILALDGALYWLVIRPLHTVSQAADRVSRGDADVPPLELRGEDEIADVTASFNRMRVSLVKALKMLE
jgi:HAMP domain-containing protein